jgi:hypothetical protein
MNAHHQQHYFVVGLVSQLQQLVKQLNDDVQQAKSNGPNEFNGIQNNFADVIPLVSRRVRDIDALCRVVEPEVAKLTELCEARNGQ